MAQTLRTWWMDHRAILLRTAIVFMSIAAVVWLGYESWRLLLQSGELGAGDMKVLQAGVQGWVRGVDPYVIEWGAAYPPASFIILWPLLGWLGEEPARWLWGATTLVALGGLIYFFITESGADTRLERAFVGLMPPSAYAIGATIGNGQVGIHTLAALAVGVLLLRNKKSWVNDFLAAALIVVSLAKPSISAPFFWIVLFVPKRITLALAVAAGYVALTLVAGSFQPTNLIVLIQQWSRESSLIAAYWGTSNTSIWLARLGLVDWMMPTSLLILGALGIWIWRHRQNDLWVLLGVAAICARLWSYHMWYDDLLILLPMITLFRISKRNPYSDGSDVIAGILLGATLLFMLAPGGLYLFPSPLNMIYVAAQVIVWIIVLVFLAERARHAEQVQTA